MGEPLPHLNDVVAEWLIIAKDRGSYMVEPLTCPLKGSDPTQGKGRA